MTVIFGAFAILLVLLATLLALFAGLFALSVVLSFSIAWIERVHGDSAEAGERRPGLVTRLLLTEFVCLLLTLLFRPLGWLPARIPAGPARRPPVILLHGLFQNRSCLFVLHWRLRVAGFDRVVSINTPPWHNLETLVDTVATTVETCNWLAAATRFTWSDTPWGGFSPVVFCNCAAGRRTLQAA
jgi:hypothetical protein